jgi:hypothetical protein
MRQFRSVTIRIAAVVTLFGLAAGCNSEKLPNLGTVTGTITMDGKPLSGANVAFDPVAGGAPPSVGKADADGKYELYYSRGHKGAPIGEHTVRINTYAERDGDDGRPQIQKETIPARYNVKTELKVSVKRGANTLDLALKSGGEIIQPDEGAGGGKGPAGRSPTGCW